MRRRRPAHAADRRRRDAVLGALLVVVVGVAAWLSTVAIDGGPLADPYRVERWKTIFNPAAARSGAMPLTRIGPVNVPRRGSLGYERASVVSESGDACSARS